MFLEENEMILKIANWEYRSVKVENHCEMSIKTDLEQSDLGGGVRGSFFTISFFYFLNFHPCEYTA